MFWDMQKEADAIVRRMTIATRLVGFIVASLAHLMASLSVLLWQTSCLYPRCVQGLTFDIVRGVMQVPLFVTPWLGLPSPDDDFQRGWALFGCLVLNAMLAVLVYAGLTMAARRCHAGWRVSRSRASSACSARHGT
jgi:hypothetical protein